MRVRRIKPDGAGLTVIAAGRLRHRGHRAFKVSRTGGALIWQPPPALAQLWPEHERDVTTELERPAQAVLVDPVDGVEWELPTQAATRIPGSGDSVVAPRVVATVAIDPATAAAGEPLRPGVYPLRVTLGQAGFWAEGAVRDDEEPLAIRIRDDGTAVAERTEQR